MQVSKERFPLDVFFCDVFSLYGSNREVVCINGALESQENLFLLVMAGDGDGINRPWASRNIIFYIQNFSKSVHPRQAKLETHLKPMFDLSKFTETTQTHAT